MAHSGRHNRDAESIELEREELRRERIDARSVLLLFSSRHGGCDFVRAFLQGDPRWEFVGDVDAPDLAAAVARRSRPFFILVATDLADGPLVSVVERLRKQSPESKVIVLSETAEGLRQQELVDQGVLIRLLWRNVSQRGLEHALETAALGLRLESPELQEAPAGLRRRNEAALVLNLNEQQRKVVASLRAGREYQQIARAMRRSRRRIEDIAREMRVMTDSDTNAELIDKLRDLDLGEPIPEE